MTLTELQTLATEAIKLKNAIDAVKAKELDPLEEQFTGIKAKIEREFMKMGRKDVTTELGDVRWMDRPGRESLDAEAIMAKLNVPNLDEYKKVGEGVHFIQCFPKKVAKTETQE